MSDRTKAKPHKLPPSFIPAKVRFDSTGAALSPDVPRKAWGKHPDYRLRKEAAETDAFEADFELTKAKQRIRRKHEPQARSNPVPSAPTYHWHTDNDGNMVGICEGRAPIVIQASTPAPLRRFKHDPGTVIRSLGDGLGTVKLSPKQAHRKEKRELAFSSRLVHSPRKGAVLVPDRRQAVKHGYTAPKSPSWRQEIAGWSADYRIERGSPSLFDQCQSMGRKQLHGWERAPSW